MVESCFWEQHRAHCRKVLCGFTDHDGWSDRMVSVNIENLYSRLSHIWNNWINALIISISTHRSLSSRCAGYLFQRVGKIVATAVGGGFLLLQVWIIKMHASYSLAIWRIMLQCHLSYGGNIFSYFRLPTTVAMCRLTGGKWRRMSIKLKSIWRKRQTKQPLSSIPL